MSGMIWRFSCCQKKKDRGQHLSKTKQKGKGIHGLSLQPSTDGIDIAHVNDFQGGGQCELPERTTEFLSNTPVERKPKANREDQGHRIHEQNISIGVHLNGVEPKDFVEKVGGSVGQPSERERDYQLIRKQLETMQKEKHELEAQVLLANQNVRDLRHEIAMLQKRLQVAENRLPNLPPLCPPPPPPLPPPAPPHVNPLRALLTLIQKRRSTRDCNICPLQDAGPLPDRPEDADVTNHQCPGMNEVLEMIRGGVSLRHVIRVHKVGLRVGEDCSEPGGSRVEPELQKILRKRKVSADKHVSDGSCDGSVEEDPSAPGPSPPRDSPTRSSGPGEGGLQSTLLQENFTRDPRGTDCEVDEGQSDGDAASTASTLPLTCPLDQGQVDSVNASPCPGGPATEASDGQPRLDGHADHWAGLTYLRRSEGFPVEHSAAVDPTLPSNCSPNQSPALRYLNWERWSGVDLKAALPFKSIFKSVSVMTDGGGGEKVVLQAQPDRRSSSLEALESDRSCQSFGSADFGEGTPDVPEDTRGQFSLLHDLLKPPMATYEGRAPAAIASQVARVLSGEFLEESVDGPEPDGAFTESQPRLAFVPPERGSGPHRF